MSSERQTKYGRSSYRLVREQRMLAKKTTWTTETTQQLFQLSMLSYNIIPWIAFTPLGGELRFCVKRKKLFRLLWLASLLFQYLLSVYLGLYLLRKEHTLYHAVLIHKIRSAQRADSAPAAEHLLAPCTYLLQ